jgi:type IV pilus assembly protein PilC
MPNFAYTARNERGKLIRGVMDTPDKAQVIEKLQSAGLYVTGVIEKKATNIRKFIEVFAVPKQVSIAIFCREFATMINAGLPLLRAITLLIDHVEDKPLQNALKGVRDSVRSGSTLADAFKNYPRVFSELFVSSVAAGEAGGMLDLTLKRLADHVEKEVDLKNKVKAALTYPIILITATVIIIGIFMLFVIPSFIPLFLESKVPLPLPTLIIYKLGILLHSYGIIILIWAVLSSVGFGTYIRTPKGRLKFDRFKINMPIFGKIIRQVEAARFSATLETLIISGVPLLRSMELLYRIATNKVVALLIEDVQNSVKGGNTISEPISKSDVFPPMVADMLAVGEETGNIEEMLTKISDFFIREVENTTKKLASVLEPILLLFMGSVVVFVALSILLPMFRMVQVLKQQ